MASPFAGDGKTKGGATRICSVIYATGKIIAVSINVGANIILAAPGTTMRAIRSSFTTVKGARDEALRVIAVIAEDIRSVPFTVKSNVDELKRTAKETKRKLKETATAIQNIPQRVQTAVGDTQRRIGQTGNQIKDVTSKVKAASDATVEFAVGAIDFSKRAANGSKPIGSKVVDRACLYMEVANSLGLAEEALENKALGDTKIWDNLDKNSNRLGLTMYDKKLVRSRKKGYKSKYFASQTSNK